MKQSEFTKMVMVGARDSSQKGEIKRHLQFYRDSGTAMMDHMRNMILTYGKSQVYAIIKDMIESGDFNE